MSAVTHSPADVKSNRPLAIAVALGTLNALWALFQWAELLLARQGGTPFCSVDETFNCAAVWDSPFAIAVHDMTQVPIAGWGLMWGITATILPLLALTDGGILRRGVAAAMRLTAIAGIISVAGLATASAIAGALCIGCIGTYILVTGWSAIAWWRTREDGFVEAPRGVAIAAAIVVASYAVLFVPGTRTPHAQSKLELPTASAKPSTSTTPSTTTTPATTPPPSESAKTTDMFAGPPTGDPVRDDLLARFIEALDPQARQIMSDLLRDYREAPQKPVPPGRALATGDKNAALKIVDWTDPLCPHCAQLHEALKEIEKSVPPGLFSVDARHFPLDGFCNTGVQRKSEDGVRCIGAKAQICLEGDPKAFEASGALFAARAQTVDAVYEALKPYKDRKSLEKCIGSKATEDKLQADIQAGLALNLEGTPLLIMNGKEVRPFPPLVYALILTGGADRHAAFGSLPPPRPKQGGEHDGHAH